MITRVEPGERPFDAWTAIHAGVGVGAGAAGLNPWLYTGAIIAYEVVENMAEGHVRKTIFGASKPESDVNIMADLAVGLLGFIFGRWVAERRK